METIALVTADGTQLAATRYIPVSAAKAIVLISNAMGVSQRFYHDFACYLADHEVAVFCFDYRGIGASIPQQYQHSLRGFDSTISDWAEQDYNTALKVARAWQPDLPLIVIGHSLGGQLPGLLPDRQLIDGLITVASGSGYWRENVPQLKRFVWLLWYFLAPVYTAVWGYFPGKKLRKVGNLPKGVMQQWTRWCKSPYYVIDADGNPIRKGYAELDIPILSMSFSDDEMMSRRNIDSLHDFYQHAQIEKRHVNPHEIGAKRIGHMGFFRAHFRHTLWQQTLDWLLATSMTTKKAVTA